MNERKEFMRKVVLRLFKTAELVNGNGFIEIRDSWVEDDGSGPKCIFLGRFENQAGIWFEDDLKNYCL
jgi:hypothetical protein